MTATDTEPVVVARWVPPALEALLLEASPDHREIVEAAYWSGVKSGSPYVGISPAMKSGQPTINNTRLPVYIVCGHVWLGETVDEVAAEFDITRGDVLVACWYAGTYGLPSERRLGLAPKPKWRQRWGVWAESVRDALWATRSVDYDTIPDPPDRDGD